MDENARYMVAIADAGSISEAARRTYVSQPALSQRLKQLEARLGVELFDRQATPLEPTHAGDVYLDWARQAMQAEETMENEVSAIANRARRRLRIGTSLSRGGGILPDVLEEFYREVGGCTVFVEEAATPAEHERLFACQQIDCALLTPVVPEGPGITGEAICRERMVLAAPRGMGVDAFSKGEAWPLISVRDAARMPFVMPPHNQRNYRTVRSMMDASAERFNVVFHSCSNEMTLQMVARGMGVTILPDTFVLGPLRDHLALYEIDGLARSGLLYYSRRRDTSSSDDEAVFVSMLRDWIGSHPEFALK